MQCPHHTLLTAPGTAWHPGNRSSSLFHENLTYKELSVPLSVTLSLLCIHTKYKLGLCKLLAADCLSVTDASPCPVVMLIWMFVVCSRNKKQSWRRRVKVHTLDGSTNKLCGVALLLLQDGWNNDTDVSSMAILTMFQMEKTALESKSPFNKHSVHRSQGCAGVNCCPSTVAWPFWTLHCHVSWVALTAGAVVCAEASVCCLYGRWLCSLSLPFCECGFVHL